MKRNSFIKSLLAVPFIPEIASKLAEPKVAIPAITPYPVGHTVGPMYVRMHSGKSVRNLVIPQTVMQDIYDRGLKGNFIISSDCSYEFKEDEKN